MQSCAGVRRPGAAALDLCYVAAGHYDGFFEMGLNPWDAAAGALMITEAGGLVGNFTGEADYLYQREIVAGTPKVYGALVKILAPYSRVIGQDEAAQPQEAPADQPEAALARTLSVEGQAASRPMTAGATGDAAAADAPKPKRAPIRIRRQDT
jgi:myo-inositol-1(or 4)-monophosphatase